MATNHRISSNVYDGYHGAVKAKELHSQKQHKQGDTRTGLGADAGKPRPQTHDGGIDRDFKQLGSNIGSGQLRNKTGEYGHRHGEIDRHRHSRSFDSYDFVEYNFHRKDAGQFPHEKQKNGLTVIYGTAQGTMQTYQLTKITVAHSVVFSGIHFGSLKKSNEANQDFLNAALRFIEKPGEQTYKSLNDAMTKLMDPRFAPAIVGGAAQMKIRDINGATMIKFTMEVTPAPTKTLDEAREDLKNAYSSRRDSEKDIASIRAEAYANYIRALSENFKKNGVISHTNNTPTTPVFKSSVIYIVKITQVNVMNFREIKRPEFAHNLHGKLTFKNQREFWNDYRPNHGSYVDRLKHDSTKSHMDKDSKTRKAIEAKHDHRHSDETRVKKTGHKRHDKAKTVKSS